ncbi:MAG: YkgJ family cysteine cluster protein [Polyangiaceae bacterium]|nr:YkgJ family cysteine cluster protein [Polyangiaceae bacterium]MBK8936442.1 YkgJ family cysteine cluster protein [Polyangiaceae bacterium]
MAERRGPLGPLWEQVDAAYAHVREASPGALACRAGCADCCVSGLTIGAEEVAVIANHLASLSRDERERLRALVARPETTWCLLLDDDMGCSIYPARPTVCRVFGLPIRTDSDPDDRRHLPLYDRPRASARVVGTCHKNFITEDLERLDPRSVVDDRGLWAVRGPTIGAEPVGLLDAVRRLLSA